MIEIRRPMVSVCMAVYNGEKYINEQIKSILRQLEVHDELVIIDDFSSDKSVKIIESLKDDRIIIYKNTSNIGVIKSFEKSILLAKGEIIFLSDQDDLWAPEKIAITLKEFESEDIVCVVSNALIITSDTGSDRGVLKYKKTMFDLRRSSPGIMHNLVRNSFQGCAMAFRASIKNNILPFPKHIPMHDQWIGMISSIIGRVVFIPNILVYYRRHGENLTDLKSKNILKSFLYRIILIVMILKRYVSIYFNLQK